MWPTLAHTNSCHAMTSLPQLSFFFHKERNVRRNSSLMLVVSVVLILTFALPVMAGSLFASGTTDKSDPTLPHNKKKHYEPVPFCVSESGTYILDTVSADYPTKFFLYQDTVTEANEIVRDRNASKNTASRLEVNLEANQPYVLAVSGVNRRRMGNYEVSITGPGAVESTCDFPVANFADRLNGYDIAAPVAVYPVNYGAGTGLHIYAISDGGEGALALEVTPEMIAAVPAMPAENTLIASTADGSIALYRLATGEFQLNAGEYVIVFSELYSSAAYYTP